MTRYAFLSLALVCTVGLWLTNSRADEEKAAPSGSMAELMTRIEKLEKRLAVLEDREQYPRQVNAVADPSDLKVPQPLPQGNTTTPKAAEGTRPAARVWLLKQTEQKPAASAK